MKLSARSPEVKKVLVVPALPNRNTFFGRVRKPGYMPESHAEPTAANVNSEVEVLSNVSTAYGLQITKKKTTQNMSVNSNAVTTIVQETVVENAPLVDVEMEETSQAHLTPEQQLEVKAAAELRAESRRATEGEEDEGPKTSVVIPMKDDVEFGKRAILDETERYRQDVASRPDEVG
jgi:hypothetical protein